VVAAASQSSIIPLVLCLGLASVLVYLRGSYLGYYDYGAWLAGWVVLLDLVCCVVVEDDNKTRVLKVKLTKVD
jgi:hypothetical protein